MDKTGLTLGKLSRRSVISAAAALGCTIALGGTAAAAPKETGLPFEGLLKGQLGFQPRRPMAQPAGDIPGFLSKAQLAVTYSAYRRAFAQLLAVEGTLGELSRDAPHAAQYAELRARQVGAGNSVLLHEFFFRNLTSRSVKPSPYVTANMKEHMGSFAQWREDFAACARAAKAWATLVYDPYDDRWHNVPLGETDAGGWAGANPLVVLSVTADTWALDYPNRDSYVERFFDHLDWNVVAARYHAVDRH